MTRADLAATPMNRLEEEGDWIIRQFIPPVDLELDPEEYVARHAHSLGNFSFHFYRSQDPALESWVHRVAELLASEEEVQRCRARYLSPDEIAAAQMQDAESL